MSMSNVVSVSDTLAKDMAEPNAPNVPTVQPTEVTLTESTRQQKRANNALTKTFYEKQFTSPADEYYPLTIKYTGKDGEKECGIGCGNDLEDILLIIACYGVLWSFALCFLGILLKAAIDTDEGSTILYMFLGFAIAFLIFMILAVQTGQMEKKKREDKRIHMGLESSSDGAAAKEVE